MRAWGVHFMAGTDTPYPPQAGCILHDELGPAGEGRADADGGTARATLKPARFLGREKELRSVAKGRVTDPGLLDADPLKGLAQSFFAAIQHFLAAPWAVTESDFIYEKTRGQRPNDFHQRLKLNLALQRVASEDATVHQIMSEVTHLVKRSSALRDPQIVSRVTALMSASG